MSVKKFIAPHLALLIILSTVWLAGIDTVVVTKNSHQDNLTKYLQVQRRVLDNYFGDTSIDLLHKRSIAGMVKNLKNSSSSFEGTPLDTTAAVSIENLRDSYSRFEEAYLYIANNYPDQDMDLMVKESIQAIVDTLDHHSASMIAIHDSNDDGYTNDDVMRRLRAEKGTTVDVRISRPRTSAPLNFTITRDDIPITTVDTHYMLDEKTGYIKVNRFAATTHDEFMAAAENLMDQGMERIILDLGSNPGGYLSQAIAISEEFFPSNTKLVSTQSRHTRFNSEVYSRKDGALKDMPVIVLVNEGSASASEIVSGAIQDHDRGLVVGKRTFGKGLVQQQYELIDKSNIRVTISRYYTPSGRLIQKPFEGGAEDYAFEIRQRSNNAAIDINEFKSQIPDSLMYKTAMGRTVFGGGGIVPDFIVQEDTTQTYLVYNYMRLNRIDFDFIREYLDNYGDEFRAEWESDFQDFRANFEFEPEDIEHFTEMMLASGMVFDPEAEEPDITDDDKMVLNEADYQELLWMNLGQMKAELARQVWGSEYYYPVINDVLNEPLNEAMTLWETAENIDLLVQTQTGSLLQRE